MTGRDLRVVEIDVAATYPLRQAVLRTGTPSTSVAFDGDDVASTFHLGVLDGETVVCVSTWLAQPFPDAPADIGHQLRGMATDPRRRGEGAGSLVLVAGLARCAELGARCVWARARSTAVGFYEAHDFEVVGSEFIDEATALPHRTIVRRL